MSSGSAIATQLKSYFSCGRADVELRALSGRPAVEVDYAPAGRHSSTVLDVN